MSSNLLRNRLKLPEGAVQTVIISILWRVDVSFIMQASISCSLQYLSNSMFVHSRLFWTNMQTPPPFRTCLEWAAPSLKPSILICSSSKVLMWCSEKHRMWGCDVHLHTHNVKHCTWRLQYILLLSVTVCFKVTLLEWSGIYVRWLYE